MILLNGKEINVTIFPDKTSQVWKLDQDILDSDEYKIEWRFESESEFLHLAQLNTLLKTLHEDKARSLHLPYFPYARQDKEVSNDATFAKKTFLDLLWSLELNWIDSFDVHSEVGNRQYNIRSRVPIREVITAAVRCGADLFVYPDIGASHRYTTTFSTLFDSIHADKIRNQNNGEIVGMKLIGSPEGKVCLIVDDLCDGGRTFTELAKLLYENGAKEVHLYVSHGIFSKGLQVLKDAGIKKIFTKEGLKDDTSN